MKILMLTPYLPYPPNSGGQIRTYNLLRNLSKEHSITLVSLYKNESEKLHLETLRSFCEKVYLCKRAEKPWTISNILRSVFGVLPFLIVRNYSSEASKIVHELLSQNEFDVIHAETFYIMPHIPKTTVPILLVEQTLEYMVYKHFISKLPWYIREPLKLDIAKLKYWEQYYWQRAQLVATVSHADASAINYLCPNIKPIVIPNGASDEMFKTSEVAPITQRKGLLFVGNFSWLQNTEAALFLMEKVMPIVSKNIKHIELVVAGQNIPRNFMDFRSKSIQFVSLDDAQNSFVRDLYHNSHVFIAPIFGPGGTRLKILSAMASKTPIITTKTGCQGLHLKDDDDYLLAESAEEFAQAIQTLLTNSQMRSKLADNAYKIAMQFFSWSSITDILVKAYQDIKNNKHQ
jgi:polysaccharide biosynthesis protein PslH